MQGRRLAGYAFVVSFALTGAPLLNFLLFHHYDPFRPEALLCFFVLVLVGLIAAGAARACRPLGLLMVALAGGLYLDYLLRPASWREMLGPVLALVPVAAVKLSIAGAALGLLLLGLHRLSEGGWRALGAGAVVALLGAAALGGWQSTAPKRSGLEDAGEPGAPHLPLYLHIIFDGHMGIAWTPRELAMARVAEQEMLAFYRRFGFLAFTRAFSRYAESKYAIAAALNFGAGGAAELDTLIRPHPSHPDSGGLVDRNRLFDHLVGLGYRIRVYQSTYLDYCAAAQRVELCLEHQANGIEALQHADLPIHEKTLLVLGTWLSGSAGFGMLTNWTKDQPGVRERLRDVPILGVDAQYNAVGPLALEDIFRQLRADVAGSRGGTAFFAHLLVPHSPYVYDSQCRLKPHPGQWTPYHVQTRGEWNARYEKYYEQLRCLYRTLNEWFTGLDARGLLRDAVVVLHGDHGSRIGYHGPDSSPPRLTQDFHATLFAVRARGVTAGITDLIKPIDLLLEQSLVEADRLLEPAPTEAYLVTPDASTPTGWRSVPIEGW